MVESPTTLNSLAAKVSELSNTLTKFLNEHQITAPTLEADSPISYSGITPEIFMLRQSLLDVLNDMSYMVQGPSESVFNYCHTVMPDAAALSTLNHFDFWSAVPIDGTASYEEIAKHTALPLDVTKRVLQHGFTLRIFAESEPGQPSSQVKHTSRSAALARSSGLRALVSTVLDDAGAPMMVMNQALEKYSQGKSSLTANVDETSFALLHNGKYRNSWEFIESDGDGDKKGWRQRNFVEFMRYIKEIFNLEDVVANCIDWKALGNTTVVDVGGSGGHDAVVLAQKFENLTITVQDLPMVETEFKKNLPSDLKSRVSFVPHDFYQPQPISADVYLVKMILHDYTDQEAARILHAMIPALKPGARVILIEYIGKVDNGDSASLPLSIQQMGTATDLRMMALFNAKERPLEDWKRIFTLADERFEVARVKADPLAFFAVIEAVWRG